MGAVQQVLMAAGTSIFLPSDLFAAAEALSYDSQVASATVNLNFYTNGTLTLDYNARGTERTPGFDQFEQYNWLVGGLSNLYSVRMRRTFGQFSPGSAAVDTWLPITSDRFWYLQSISSTFALTIGRSFTGVLEIAFSDNLTNILAQSSVNFSAFAETVTFD
jgi:hypothetical protein